MNRPYAYFTPSCAIGWHRRWGWVHRTAPGYVLPLADYPAPHARLRELRRN